MASEQLNLSNLKPAQARKDRKRVGRGLGSGKGRYSGRGIKGQKSRAGSHKMRAGFEGGQMPIYMRLGKLRGSTSKDAMPIGPFRTYSQPVNVAALERFDAGTEVTPELLKEAGLISTTRKDVKLLGNGELTKKLTVVAHAVSATAREKIEAAGGIVTLLREPKVEEAKKQGEGRRRAGRAESRSEPSRPTESRETRCSPGSPTPGASPSCGGACSSRPSSSRSTASARGSPRRASTRSRSQTSSTPAAAAGRPRPAEPVLRLALSRFSIFALGIMPYVTASIILQLMTVVVPTLEQLQKEGEAGYAKINQYTRYLTVALAAAQSLGYAFLFKQRRRAARRTPGGSC